MHFVKHAIETVLVSAAMSVGCASWLLGLDVVVAVGCVEVVLIG